MHRTRFHRILLLAVLAQTFATGCEPLSFQGSLSRTEAVSLPQTEVRDQGRWGLCWAYATNAFLEAESLRKNGKALDLSEMGLFFKSISASVYGYATTNGGTGVIPGARGFVQPSRGNALMGAPASTPLDEASPGAFGLLYHFGVVPEAEFPNHEEWEEEKIASEAARLNARVSSFPTIPLAELTFDFIEKRILLDSPMFPSPFPASFVFDGNSYTPISFLREYIGVKPEEWVELVAVTPSELGRVIQGIKLALSKGHPVPLSFPIDWHKRKTGGVFSSFAQERFTQNLSHSVLATDFVNRGGRAGAVAPDELRAEVEKSPWELELIHFKNSWGIQLNDEWASPSGYYQATLGYLISAMNTPNDVGEPMFSAVIPRTIADKVNEMTLPEPPARSLTTWPASGFAEAVVETWVTRSLEPFGTLAPDEKCLIAKGQRFTYAEVYGGIGDGLLWMALDGAPPPCPGWRGGVFLDPSAFQLVSE